MVINGQVKNEGNVEVGGFGPYPISYRSLIPKTSEVNNIFVPVCLSATHIGYGSIRMEPVFMVLAQSSATAAVMAIDANTDVHHVDVAKLQERLKTDPLADGRVFDILVDNDDLEHVTKMGQWSVEKKGGYGPSYFIGESGAAEHYVRFAPAIPRKGRYAAYIYFPKAEGTSSKTTVAVFDGKVKKDVVIRESDVRVEGQTSGEWVALGTYELAVGKQSYAEVTSKNADGKVIADAIIWVPVK